MIMTVDGRPILDMQHVSKVYGAGDTAVKALDDVDFQVNAGEVVLVMGPSGAGKTTFLTIAGALLKPTSGSVIVSGSDITKLNEKDLPDVDRKSVV